PLTFEDADAIVARATHVVGVQPELSRQLQVEYGNHNTSTTITGTTSNYLEVRNFSISSGRMFTNAEDAARRRVAVVGQQVVDDLGLASADAIVGENVRIDDKQFEVVGVLSPKGQGAGFQNPDDQVLVPIQTARYRVIGSDRLRSI